MTVWSEPLSILRRRRILQKICLALVFVVIITTTLFIVSQRNAEAAPSTVSFTARLKTADGSVGEDIKPGMLYALDRHDAHFLIADPAGDMVLISVFNPPLRGDERHDLGSDGFSHY